MAKGWVKRKDPEILREDPLEFLEMMRFSIDRSSDAVSWIGPDARLIYVNDTACRALGYSREELLTMTVHDIDPNFPPGAWRPHWDELKKRGSLVVRTVHLTKDGRRVPVEVTANYLAFDGREFNCSFARDISERKGAEEALRESEGKFRTLTEKSLVGVYLVQDGIFRYVNPMMTEIFGYTMEELTAGMGPVDLVHPDDWQTVKENLRKRVEGELESAHYGFRCVRKDGKVIDIEVFGSVTMYRGRPAVLGSLLDITDRKRTEEALRDSERRLTNLLGNLPGMVYQCSNDADWTMQFVSEGALDITGYRPSELVGNAVTSYAALIHPEDRDGVWRQVQSALEEKRPFRIAYRIIDRADSERWVWEQGRGIFDEGGELMYLDGYIFDITERKKAEEAMERLLTAVENSSDWVLITDKKGNITYVNKAVVRISGYEKDELLGGNPRIFKSGLHNSQFYKDMWDTLLSGRTFSGIVTNRRKDGELFDMYHTITPLSDSKGEISNFVATSKDVTQEKLMENKINFLAYYDSLTGLPNRILLMDRLKQAITRAKYNKRFVSVLSIDIDRFSLINDTYGAGKGDEVLKAFGKRLLSSVREGDTVARLGSDEFGIAFTDMAHSEDIIVMLKKIMAVIREPLKVGEDEVMATASIGISIYPDDAYDAESALQNANVAMLNVKKKEMNNYQFFTPDINIKSSEFLRLEKNLYKALQNNEFVLHYQPYFLTDSRQNCGMEALLRWNSPELGLVSPGQFIPALEETRLIIDVGHWILQTVCGKIRQWQEKGYNVVPVAVNFSSVQFRQRDLAEMLHAAVKDSGIDPRLLTVEITESTSMEDIAYTKEVIAAIKRLGATVSIDDFGTGFSSLSYLKQLSADNLKIDRSFIKDIADNPDDASIVTTVISMARNLNMKAIAEGVETEEQWKILRLLRCDMVQGFYFSRPVPTEEIEKLLARQTGK